MEIKFWRHPRSGTCHRIEAFWKDSTGKIEEIVVETECGMTYRTAGISRFDPTESSLEQTAYVNRQDYCGRCDWSDVETLKDE